MHAGITGLIMFQMNNRGGTPTGPGAGGPNVPPLHLGLSLSRTGTFCERRASRDSSAPRTCGPPPIFIYLPNRITSPSLARFFYYINRFFNLKNWN